jgi:hypothetical protein
LKLRRIFAALVLLFPLYGEAADILTATFPENLSAVQVSLCFKGRAPTRLYRHEQAGKYSSRLFHNGTQLDISNYGSTIRLPALPENACLNWQTDFTAALKKKDYRLIMQRDNDLVMATKLWFWKGPKRRDLLVDVQLPPGMSVSAPWQEVNKTGSTIRFRPDKTSADWESRFAVGDFVLDIIEVPGAAIRLAAPGKLSGSQRTKIRQWIEKTVSTVTAVYGHFPQPQPQVLVIPIGDRSRAVAKANVVRGGGLAAVFYIDETRSLAEFMNDWKATHEFSHMLIPYVTSRDRWLSEGLASYYQNVLRARDGRMTETQAWQKLHDGFQRGKNGTNGGSLAQATRSGRNSTMRVYWSGAAILLLADVQLRQITGGHQSLDTALQSLSACCMSNAKTWRAKEMFEHLDSLTGTEIFMDLYDRYVYAYSFPDMRSTWKDLGVQIRYNQVSLTPTAPLANIRTTIMTLE